MQHQLDNPVWHALVGPHAAFAIGRGAARQYPRDMAPFAAIAEPSAAAYEDLMRDLPKGTEARLFRSTEEWAAPPGWETISARPIVQMVLTDNPPVAPKPVPNISILSMSDSSEMMALAEAAKPGPFGPRTGLLGEYVGVRSACGLVAMAGERFRLPGFVELSGICVHPGARGQRLGAALTMHLAHKALTRGDKPFLHVFPDNPARLLYERLGFRERARLWVLWRRPFAPDAS